MSYVDYDDSTMTGTRVSESRYIHIPREASVLSVLPRWAIPGPL